jgi:hypothetical protein
VWRQRQTASGMACHSDSEARTISAEDHLNAGIVDPSLRNFRAVKAPAFPAVRLRSLTVVTKLYQYFSHS